MRLVKFGCGPWAALWGKPGAGIRRGKSKLGHDFPVPRTVMLVSSNAGSWFLGIGRTTGGPCGMVGGV